jgi:hypothetical protein
MSAFIDSLFECARVRVRTCGRTLAVQARDRWMCISLCMNVCVYVCIDTRTGAYLAPISECVRVGVRVRVCRGSGASAREHYMCTFRKYI